MEKKYVKHDRYLQRSKRNWLERLRFIFLFILCVFFAQGKGIEQGQTVTGTVTDPGGASLPGVSVIVKGTMTGVVTDLQGVYSINVPKGSILVFSFIGYSTVEEEVGIRTTINVTLHEDTQELDEIIVIGYGTARRKDFTGSVSSVKMEDSPIALLPNMNVLESLKGNVSGLNIGATNSSGGQPSMLIRGQNSITGSNNPLVVLDGVIFMGNLSDINPNDIASFDILKDAVSAAVYGSRAANGIIAITTKKGHSAKPLITFNVSAGIQTWPNRPEMMKGEDWIELVNDRLGYSEGSTNWLKTGEMENYNAGRERVWLDEVTRTGSVQDYQLSISGAGKDVSYYLSAVYSENTGVVVGDDFNRVSLFGKINTDITNWLNIGVDANFSQRDYSGIGANLRNAQLLSPYGVMYRDDQNNLEKYPITQGIMNPLWGVNDGTRDNKDIRQNLRLNTYVLVTLPWIRGLSYKINFLPNLYTLNQDNFYYEDYYVGEGEGVERYDPSVVQNYLSSANGERILQSTYSYILDNILTYKSTFGKHDIEGTLVATRDMSRFNSQTVSGNDFSENGNTSLGIDGLHKARVQKIDLNANKRTNIGYLGRINYSFNQKYYLTGSIRRDGASVFGINKKWGTFAATGASWRISQENFMKNIKPLNDLKVKFSWGQNGNQGIDPYTTLSKVVNGSSGGYYYEFNDDPGKVYYGLAQSTLGNYDLGWESTTGINAGFESTWLDQRFFVDLDIYSTKTRDQIFTRNIPIMTGFKTITTSMGQVDNKGVELTVRSINIRKKDWTWITNVTFWQNRNKLTKLYGEDLDGDGKEDDDVANSLFIGESLGAIYGYKQIGIVQEDDIDYINVTGASPGTPKYADIDGVPGISTNDRSILGFTKENFRLNMSNTVRYKGFELYLLLTGIFGGNGYYLAENTPAYLSVVPGLSFTNSTYKSYWTPENRSNVYPRANFSSDSRFLGIQSRGFVRVQDLSLSYTFDEIWTKKIDINAFKVFFATKNLYTFTGWKGGDPETGALYLSTTYPVVSTYSIGVNISF